MRYLLLAMLLLLPIPEKEKEKQIREGTPTDPSDCYLQWHREGRGPIYMIEEARFTKCRGKIHVY